MQHTLILATSHRTGADLRQEAPEVLAWVVGTLAVVYLAVRFNWARKTLLVLAALGLLGVGYLMYRDSEDKKAFEESKRRMPASDVEFQSSIYGCGIQMAMRKHKENRNEIHTLRGSIGRSIRSSIGRSIRKRG